ncbi:hypothetical protein EMCRGX_G002664 [Ephydatia muelleri]
MTSQNLQRPLQSNGINERSGVRELPASTSTPRCALREMSTKSSCNRLWQNTTSSPCLQNTVWLFPWIQCYINKQHEALVVFKPNHRIMAALNSLGSKCKPGSTEIRTEINEVANEANVDKRQGLFLLAMLSPIVTPLSLKLISTLILISDLCPESIRPMVWNAKTTKPYAKFSLASGCLKSDTL